MYMELCLGNQAAESEIKNLNLNLNLNIVPYIICNGQKPHICMTYHAKIFFPYVMNYY